MPSLQPSAVSFLAAAVFRHCERYGISSQEGRESVAASALSFYERGAKGYDQLLSRLAAEDDPDRRKR